MARFLLKKMKRKSLKIKINRLFVKKIDGKTKFFASIRDYLVKKAKEEKKDLLVFCEKLNEEILIPYERLNEGIVNTENFRSKIDNKVYKLIDFEWEKFKGLNLEDPKVFSQLIL
jgi:hypothetical protein